MGLKGELQLLETLKKFDMNCVHKLKQKKITDFFIDANPLVKKECKTLLRKNRMLPRSRLTYEVDLLAWKNNTLHALAIEQKNQNGAPKILDIDEREVVLRALCTTGRPREYKRSARNLWLQCLGEGYLSRAYCAVRNLNKKVIPFAAVDYTLRVRSAEVPWAFHKGVFFVQNNSFEFFLKQLFEKDEQIKRVIEEQPDLAFPENGRKNGWKNGF